MKYEAFGDPSKSLHRDDVWQSHQCIESCNISHWTLPCHELEFIADYILVHCIYKL